MWYNELVRNIWFKFFSFLVPNISFFVVLMPHRCHLATLLCQAKLGDTALGGFIQAMPGERKIMEEKKLFRYTGPVMQFGHCIGKVQGLKTYAPTEKKALSNIAFNYKKQHGLLPSARIELAKEYLVAEV